MKSKRKFIKRVKTSVVAVQLTLDTPGFTYEKWGSRQKCKRGDWIVDNKGDVYTVDRKSFKETYSKEKAGTYRKVAPVWARETESDGAIKTKEGVTRYKAGDYLVFNKANGKDGYAVSRAKFQAMYKPMA